MSLSKRAITTTFYESECPNCRYYTPFTAADIVQREFLSCCSQKKDYYTIDYDIKCQLCLTKFKPQIHRTGNSITNPMKASRLTEIQMGYLSQMKSYAAVVPPEVGSLRLNQLTNSLKRHPNFDCLSVFLVDEVGYKGENRYVYITGQNLSSEVLSTTLGVCSTEIPVTEALDFHFNKKPQIVGDVSHVFRG